MSQEFQNFVYLPQEVPSKLAGKVLISFFQGSEVQSKLLRDCHEVSHRLESEYSESLIKRLNGLQSEMDHKNAWEIQEQFETTFLSINGCC